MIKRFTPWLAATACAFSLAAPALGDAVAIIGGRVVTNTQAGILENAVVVFEDGVITAVGENAAVPNDARVIAANGKWVTPGLFAPYSRVGLAEINAEDDTNDISAADTEFSVSLRASDGFNPNATAIAVTRVEGVTRAAVAPDTSIGLFGGQGILIDTGGGPDSVFDEQAFAYVEFGEQGAAVAGGSRPAAWAYFRAALEDARGFPARFMAHKEGDAIDRYDARSLLPFIRGEAPVMVRVHREADLRELIALKGVETQMRFVVLGGAEAHRAADELATAGIPVILDPLDNLPGSFDAVGASFQNAVVLDAAETDYAFAVMGDESHNARLLPQRAGNAVAHGLSWQSAFAAITLGPAKIFGVDETLGSLEVGKVADVVVWDGDPLEVMSAPDHVFIDGEETPLTSRQTALADRYHPDADLAGLPHAYRKP